jgi:hypothetical protein
MRSFTVPVELEKFEKRGWRFSGGNLGYIDREIDNAPKAWTLARRSAGQLSKVNDLLRQSGLLGSNPDGLWKRSD